MKKILEKISPFTRPLILFFKKLDKYVIYSENYENFILNFLPKIWQSPGKEDI